MTLIRELVVAGEPIHKIEAAFHNSSQVEALQDKVHRAACLACTVVTATRWVGALVANSLEEISIIHKISTASNTSMMVVDMAHHLHKSPGITKSSLKLGLMVVSRRMEGVTSITLPTGKGGPNEECKDDLICKAQNVSMPTPSPR